jgi:hypothetical protein
MTKFLIYIDTQKEVFQLKEVLVDGKWGIDTNNPEYDFQREVGTNTPISRISRREASREPDMSGVAYDTEPTEPF